MSEPLLRVRDLTIRFQGEEGPTTVIDGVSLDLFPGETLAIVGESGSGKSVTMLAVMGLIGKGAVYATEMRAMGQDILNASDRTMRAIRGRDIGMIFQDPMTSLNPTLTIGRQLTEMFEVHLGLFGAAAKKGATDLLKLVGVPSAETRLKDYPHQFSGGMRQRVMIAMAVACKPKILIADEPTTALDVTIQAQILDIIRGLQREFGMAMIVISHDLGVVAGIADRMAVMYSGRIVEEGPVEAVFAAPQMPYTRGLLASVPRFDIDEPPRYFIKGTPPDPRHRPDGCSFSPRCNWVMPRCIERAPLLLPVDTTQSAACFLAEAIEKEPAE